MLGFKVKGYLSHKLKVFHCINFIIAFDIIDFCAECRTSLSCSVVDTQFAIKQPLQLTRRRYGTYQLTLPYEIGFSVLCLIKMFFFFLWETWGSVVNVSSSVTYLIIASLAEGKNTLEGFPVVSFTSRHHRSTVFAIPL